MSSSFSGHDVPQFKNLRDAKKLIKKFEEEWGLGRDLKGKERASELMELAIEYGRADVVQALLKAGFEVNARVKGGYTAVHLAAQWVNEKVAHVLIDAEADVNAMVDGKLTPLDRVPEPYFDPDPYFHIVGDPSRPAEGGLDSVIFDDWDHSDAGREAQEKRKQSQDVNSKFIRVLLAAGADPAAGKRPLVVEDKVSKVFVLSQRAEQNYPSLGEELLEAAQAAAMKKSAEKHVTARTASVLYASGGATAGASDAETQLAGSRCTIS